jgi:putative SOS response-associated peptidase YedK
MPGMCGRYALDQNARELANHFDLLEVPDLAPRYNIAPSTPVLAVHRAARGRVGALMTWGLEPTWTRKGEDAKKYPRPINARAESITERPMFRGAFKARRCILPASGFYEWRRPALGPAQPFYIHPANDPVFAFAGLFEPGIGDGPASCCIITTGANELMATIHDRMPVILDVADLARWLDPGTAPGALEALLVPAPADEMLAHPVSTRVNAARNEGRELTEAVPEQG